MDLETDQGRLGRDVLAVGSAMKQTDIYNELIGLADSLDDHVQEDEIAAKLRELADELRPYVPIEAEVVVEKLRERFISNPAGPPYTLHFNQEEIEQAIYGAFHDVAAVRELVTDANRLESADDTEPNFGVRIRTAGAFAARWNSMTPEQRERAVTNLMDSVDRSARCFQADHEAVMEQLIWINLVFTRIPGGPGQEAVFIEAETMDGASTRVGQWVTLMDTGYAALRLQVVKP